jgi:hypothetical protein
LGQVSVPDATEIHGIDKPDMAFDELPEAGFIPSCHKGVQQFSVIFHGVYLLSAANAKTAQNFGQNDELGLDETSLPAVAI